MTNIHTVRVLRFIGMDTIVRRGGDYVNRKP